MNLNGLTITDRGNRPSTTGRLAIKVFFINDGKYYDPYEIKDMAVFSRYTNIYPSSLLNEEGILNGSAVSSLAKAYFAASDGASYLDENEYAFGASGIYRVGLGEYVAVLDGDSGVSGYNADWDLVVGNTASAIGSYLDVWTIKNTANSAYSTVINQFTLFDDTLFTITEPLLINTNNKLITKKIPLGSKENLKITTTFSIENGSISDSIKNLVNNSIILNPMIKIEKINDDQNIPSRVEVSGYAETSGLIQLTSENTVLFPWDTDQLKTHPELLAGNLGNMRGIYAITLKYDLMTERVITPLMYVQLV